MTVRTTGEKVSVRAWSLASLGAPPLGCASAVDAPVEDPTRWADGDLLSENEGRPGSTLVVVSDVSAA